MVNSPSSQPPRRLLLRHTPGRARQYRDPRAPGVHKRRGWRSSRRAQGVKTVCAHFRDPYLTARLRHRRATVPPQALLSFTPPSPQQPDSYAGVPWQGSGVGRGGRPFDFKDIDRHSSIVQKPVNSLDERCGPILPPPHRRPAQHQLKLMAPRGLLRNRHFWNGAGGLGLLCGSRTAVGYDIDPDI